MNIIFYCQYVWGMGHFIRSLEFARALSDHDVTLVAGGQEVAVNLPDHVDLVRLPTLYMDEMFTTLIPGNSGRTVAQIRQERKKTLYALFEQKKPDVFIVELYPFGRSIFGLSWSLCWKISGPVNSAQSKPSAACEIFWWKKKIRLLTKNGFYKI